MSTIEWIFVGFGISGWLAFAVHAIMGQSNERWALNAYMDAEKELKAIRKEMKA